MIKEYFSIILANMRVRKLRAWLTMLGIFIGIAAVVSLVSLGQGLQLAIEEEFASVGTDKIFVLPSAGFAPPGGAAGSLDEHDKDVIRRTKGVEQVAGIAFFFKNVKFNDETKFVQFAGVPLDPDELELTLESFTIEAEKGRLLERGDKTAAMAGYWLFTEESAFGKTVDLRSKLEIEGVDFKVVGISSKIGNPQDDSMVIVPIDAAQDLLNVDDGFDFIYAKVAKGFNVSKVADDIKDKMRRDRGLKEGEEDFSVQTFESIAETFNNIFGIVSAVIIGIAAISLIVGGIGIMNTMYTAVLERTKEIGIMKAIGARNSDILYLFTLESGILGLVGGAVGILLGIGAGKAVQYIGVLIGYDILRASFPPTLIVGALIFSFVVGAASGVLPAVQASRLKPIEALRYE